MSYKIRNKKNKSDKRFGEYTSWVYYKKTKHTFSININSKEPLNKKVLFNLIDLIKKETKRNNVLDYLYILIHEKCDKENIHDIISNEELKKIIAEMGRNYESKRDV